MISTGIVKEPEPHDPTIKQMSRSSASLYNRSRLPSGWNFHNTLILGQVSDYDHVPVLRSALEEFLLFSETPHQYWGRIEWVERTSSQLAISGISAEARGVTAVTIGYTYRLAKMKASDLSVGSSITKSFLDSQLQRYYGGDPLSGRAFLQISGMTMGNF